MEKLLVTWKGVTPLLMHSCRCVNPLHPLAMLMKKYTSNRKKTDDDYRVMSDIEWLQGIYFNEDISRITSPLDDYLLDNMYLYIPADNIEATLRNAGKAFKLGEAIKRFVNVSEIEIPFDFGDKKLIREIWKDYRYRDVRSMVVNKKRIMRTRPRFDRWGIQFSLVYDETKINIQDIVTVIEFAGEYTGLCDSRPKYGKFTAIIEEVAG